MAAARTVRVGSLELPQDLGGVFVNLLLRLLIVGFTVDSLLYAGGDRFAGKALATMLHTQLEIQEIYGDQFLGTKNVRDIMDTANDLLAGLLGATVFVLVYKGTEWYQGKRAQPRRVGKRRA